MHTYLDDPVDVTVDFTNKRVCPRNIRWDGKEYHIKTVNLVHSAREGTTRIFYFSVSDQSNFMKLRLNTETLQWRILELYTE